MWVSLLSLFYFFVLMNIGGTPTRNKVKSRFIQHLHPQTNPVIGRENETGADQSHPNCFILFWNDLDMALICQIVIPHVYVILVALTAD